MGIGPNQTAYVRSLRYYLWIGASVEIAHGGPYVHAEVPVITPGWRFPDGNVSFHLRRLNAGQYVKSYRGRIPPFGGSPPPSVTANGLTASLLGTVDQMTELYTPPNGGMPYGQDIGGLGTTRDVRFDAYITPNKDLDLKVIGPGAAVVYASVYQTDPTMRINWPTNPSSLWVREGVCSEDKFFITFPEQARFWRVGAEMTMDLCTWEPEGWCEHKECKGYVNPDVSCEHRPAGLVEVPR